MANRNVRDNDHLRRLDVGTSLYVTKPFETERLQRAVSTVLGE